MEIKIIECPRDAMQGMGRFIESKNKIEYINTLMKCGFDTLDCASFVSPKAIPQMSDSEYVIQNIEKTNTKISVIIANMKGLETALKYKQIDYVGFPFSMSETFQKKNTNMTCNEAFKQLNDINKTLVDSNKKLVTYLSMGFGNPYNDFWDKNVVANWVEQLIKIDINFFSLSDTVGIASPKVILELLSFLNIKFPEINFGIHFHSHPHNWEEKLKAALDSGCNRIDGALLGYGGCPMANDDLVGNMPTEKMIDYLISNQYQTGIDLVNLNIAKQLASKIFNTQ